MYSTTRLRRKRAAVAKVAVITTLAVLLFTPRLDLSAGKSRADSPQTSNPIGAQIASIGAD